MDATFEADRQNYINQEAVGKRFHQVQLQGAARSKEYFDPPSLPSYSKLPKLAFPGEKKVKY